MANHTTADESAARRSPSRVPAGGYSRWVMPIGSLGETRYYLAFHVFVVVMMVTGVVTAASLRAGNSDLMIAAIYALTFWVGGWCIQSIAMLVFNTVFGLIHERQVIGMAGPIVEPRVWTVHRACGHAAVPIGALLITGMVVASLAGTPLRWLPSLGMTVTDSVTATGAWLLVVQAIAQGIPMRRTPGRLILLSTIGWAGRGTSLARQTRIAGRVLLGVAAGVGLVGVMLVGAESGEAFPRWPFVFLLALLIGMSAWSVDLVDHLQAFVTAEASPPESEMVETAWRRRRRLLESRAYDRRIRETQLKEQSEASDASQIDGILDQLHRSGMDSLSDAQRDVLVRVSRTMRRRESETESDSESGIDGAR